jgi:hypothetical protein
MKSRTVLASLAFAAAFACLAGVVLILSGAKVEKDHHDPISRRLKYISGYKQSVAYMKPDASRGVTSEEISRIRKGIVDTERDLCLKLMRNPEQHDSEAVAQCKPFQGELLSQNKHPL